MSNYWGVRRLVILSLVCIMAPAGARAEGGAWSAYGNQKIAVFTNLLAVPVQLQITVCVVKDPTDVYISVKFPNGQPALSIPPGNCNTAAVQLNSGDAIVVDNPLIPPKGSPPEPVSGTYAIDNCQVLAASR